jgi:hypothetical protein
LGAATASSAAFSTKNFILESLNMEQLTPDDGTGLRQLTNKDLIAYAVGTEQMTPLELELTMRLEQIVEQRLEIKENLSKLPCLRCPALPHLIPRDAIDAVAELDGTTQWE